MGLFDGIRRQWHEMKSIKQIKDFGVVLETKFSDMNLIYNAGIREIMGEKFLDLSRSDKGLDTRLSGALEFNRNELLVIIENFEEAIKIMSSWRGSLWEVRKESSPIIDEILKEFGRFFSGLLRVKKVIKDFGIIARQGTKDKITETCVVLVEHETEKVIYVLRREREKRSQSLGHLAFSESDAVSILSVFKNALPFM